MAIILKLENYAFSFRAFFAVVVLVIVSVSHQLFQSQPVNCLKAPTYFLQTLAIYRTFFLILVKTSCTKLVTDLEIIDVSINL